MHEAKVRVHAWRTHVHVHVHVHVPAAWGDREDRGIFRAQ